MNIQSIVVSAIILSAIVYAAVLAAKKIRSFSPKAGCAGECGCSAASKKLPS